MDRLVTPIQANFPLPSDFALLAKRWKEDAIDRLFQYVWDGFDELLYEDLFGLSGSNANLERDITQLAVQRIREHMDDFPPYYIEHHCFEAETMASPQAQPPAPDICFIWRRNPRAMLPLEAKILKTDGTVAEYLKEITDNFIPCRYAPFSSVGGMIGYLLKGRPDKAFLNIEKKLACSLVPHPRIKRDHRISNHQRTSKSCAKSPINFRCHHLIILF